jgi:hypothetical protein
MFHSKPFKKDITAFAKGGKVVKHVGKGAREQSRGSGGLETLTSADSMARMANRYPKPSDMAPSGGGLGGPPMESSPAPVPTGPRPGGAPTAMMPPDMGGGDEEE